jgi:hypothetical protein
MISNRGKDWMDFASKVLNHIEDYTVPQYGDSPDDYVESWTPAECVLALGKYQQRFGKNARAGEATLDLLKMAHFAQLAYDKIEDDYV